MPTPKVSKKTFIIIAGVIIGLILSGLIYFIRYEGIDGVWELVNPTDPQQIDCNAAAPSELTVTGDCSPVSD